jgi:hypothetical protein
MLLLLVVEMAFNAVVPFGGGARVRGGRAPAVAVRQR